MKRILLSTIAIAAMLTQTANAASYTIDSMHSKTGFEISHLVISTVDGRFNTFSGTVEMGNTLDKLQVNATIDANSIDTGIQKRDDHLRSPDFFDVAKYPSITFKSKKVSGSKDKLKILGDFTMHGVTKEITLNAKYLGSVVDQMGSERVAFQANTAIKRKDFGLAWNKLVEAGPMVGDDVSIKLTIEATKNK